MSMLYESTIENDPDRFRRMGYNVGMSEHEARVISAQRGFGDPYGVLATETVKTVPSGASSSFLGDLWGSVKGAIGGLTRSGGNPIAGLEGAIGGWGGGGGGRGTLPVFGGGAMPTLPTLPGIGTAGIGSTIGRVGAAAGGTAIVRRAGGAVVGAMKRTKWGKVIAGVGGYWILDALGNWIWQDGPAPRKSPTMNVLNPRALSRANRRVCGFSGKARPILKQLGYTVSTTRSPRSCSSKKRKCK